MAGFQYERLQGLGDAPEVRKGLLLFFITLMKLPSPAKAIIYLPSLSAYGPGDCSLPLSYIEILRNDCCWVCRLQRARMMWRTSSPLALSQQRSQLKCAHRPLQTQQTISPPPVGG